VRPDKNDREISSIGDLKAVVASEGSTLSAGKAGYDAALAER